MKKNKSIIIITLIISAYFFATKVIGLEYSCIIKNISGIPCPGCGMTRAGHSLLKFDFSNALYYNAMIFLVIIVFLIILFKNTFTKKIYSNNLFWWMCIIIFISYYIFRMIMYFPNEIPMNFDENSIIPRIMHYLNLL